MTARRASRPEPAAPATKLPPYRLAPVAELVPYARNSNVHSPAQVTRLAEMITEFGWTNPVLIDGKRGIIAGHGRVMAAQQLGMAMVPTIELRHLSAAQKRAYVIADNQSARLSSTDRDILASELLDLRMDGYNLDLTGFDALELDGLLGPAAGQTDPDDAPPVQAEAVSRLGDVWHLGKHRLMCGDCTDAAVVTAAMAGAQAVLMNTDPPYGVDYAAVKNGIPRSGFRDMQARDGDMDNDTLTDGPELQAFLESAIRAAVPHLIDRAAFYFWHPMLTQGTFFAAAAAAADILIHRQIIWVKPHMVLTRSGMYHWRHELCFYGWRRGMKCAWHGNKSQTSVWDDIQAATDRVHPTQKPVELFLRPIANHSAPGDTIYEPFCGSGSQIIAAEQTGRAAIGIEISPNYCDVAIRRWEQFTGQTATLADDGRPFSAIAAERTRRAA